MPAVVVFTDLDGTLLDHQSYSFNASRPALEHLKQRGIPLIFATSKTRAETEMWRDRIGNTDPYIFENGAAFVRPPDHLTAYGDPYSELVDALTAAAEETGCRVRGFHQMTVDEIAAATALPADQAALASHREYDEPFEILDHPCAEALLRAIEQRGKRWTRGGRFYHITGRNDKGRAVSALKQLYGNASTIGIGDGWNDLEFLKVVEVPVIIRSPQAEGLRAELPHARITSLSGPAGWNQAILEMALD